MKDEPLWRQWKWLRKGQEILAEISQHNNRNRDFKRTGQLKDSEGVGGRRGGAIRLRWHEPYSSLVYFINSPDFYFLFWKKKKAGCLIKTVGGGVGSGVDGWVIKAGGGEGGITRTSYSGVPDSCATSALIFLRNVCFTDFLFYCLH